MTDLFQRFCDRLGEIPPASDNSFILRELADAEEAVLDLIGRDVMPERLVSVQIELAIIAYNKRGAEGESSRSEGGISRSFEELPPLMLRRLKNYPRKVRVIKNAASEKRPSENSDSSGGDEEKQ